MYKKNIFKTQQKYYIYQTIHFPIFDPTKITFPEKKIAQTLERYEKIASPLIIS